MNMRSNADSQHVLQKPVIKFKTKFYERKLFLRRLKFLDSFSKSGQLLARNLSSGIDFNLWQDQAPYRSEMASGEKNTNT